MMQYKFICDSITEYTDSYTYEFSPLVSTNLNDTAIISGSMQFNVAKPKGKLFRVGTEYYIDISDYPI